MKHLTFIKTMSVLFVVLLAFTSSIAQTESNLNSNAEKDIATVKSYLEGIVSGDFEKAKTSAHENMMSYGPGVNDSATVSQVVEAWTANQKTFSNMKIKWVGAVSLLATEGPYKGTHVYLWGEFSGTDNASGKMVENRFQSTSILADGKIVASAGYYDNLNMLLQRGYTLAPPEK